MSRQLEVLLHGSAIGQLHEMPQGGTEFRFSPSYFDLVPRPVLGQKFEDRLRDLKDFAQGRRGQLPPFFANLVPEGRLREVIVKAAGIPSADDLALLAFVGNDLPGAVAVRDTSESPEFADECNAGESDQTGEEEVDRLRFSLAGVQLKFSMLLLDERLTLPLKDQSGDWIVKFDSPTFPHLPQNEFSMLKWARAAGFSVPVVQLYPVEAVEGFPRRFASPATQVLAIRRYDRTEGTRVHQEDFAQAVGLPPERKYDQVTYEAIALLARRFVGEEAVDEFVRRLVFVIACGNNDAHLKNWSLVYPDRVRAAWSPLYDQVSTVAWPSPDRELALKLAGVRNFSQIDRSALQRFAARAGSTREAIDRLVDETLSRLRDAWHSIHEALPLPVEHAEALRDHWRRVPLLREFGPLG